METQINILFKKSPNINDQSKMSPHSRSSIFLYSCTRTRTKKLTSI